MVGKARKTHRSKRLVRFILLLVISLVVFISSCGINLDLSNKDPLFTSQWGLLNDGVGKEVDTTAAEHDGAQFVKGIDINAEQMWEKQKTFNAKSANNEVVVAVIDTGIDFSNEDLKGVKWTNDEEISNDGVDNDNNGYIDDVNGWNYVAKSGNFDNDGRNYEHGTLCAGIIAARHNDVGIEGASALAKVKIMSLAVIDSEKAEFGKGDIKDLIRAIKYAERMGARVCNLSLELGVFSKGLKEVISASNMLFAVSAGNNTNPIFNIDIDKKPIYPASFMLDNVVCVASLGVDGKLSSFSNKGKKTVDLAAPGDCIISAGLNNKYNYFSGCSAAVPFVSGVAAVLLSIDKDVKAIEIKNILNDSVSKIDFLNGKVKSGGLLNGGEAVNKLLSIDNANY